MKHFICILILLTVKYNCYSQLPLSSNYHFLDSLVNNSAFGVSKIIFQKNNQHYLDTLLVDKLKISKKDSTIEIKYTNNSIVTVSQVQLWGYITDFRECRRFYKGKMYTVWRKTPPFIYKLKNQTSSPQLFFSTGITEPILELNSENISRITDTNQRNILNDFLKEYIILNSKRSAENIGTLLDITGQVLVGMFKFTTYMIAEYLKN